MLTSQSDLALYRSLSRLQRAYDSVLSVNARLTPLEKYNAEKTILDAHWQLELEQVLRDLYWYPSRNGLENAPMDDLRSWLSDLFAKAHELIGILLFILRRYQVRAATLGGQTALDMLGIDGVFRLMNAEYINQMDQHAVMLTSQGTDMSLIDTTIDDLTKAIPEAKASSDGFAEALGAYIAGRTALRAMMIERTERPRQVANGLEWTYSNNGVRMLMYDVNGIGCKEICEPLHGTVFPIDNRPAHLDIPRHIGCDCIYSNADDNWVPPDTVWRGE